MYYLAGTRRTREISKRVANATGRRGEARGVSGGASPRLGQKARVLAAFSRSLEYGRYVIRWITYGVFVRDGARSRYGVERESQELSSTTSTAS
jgi:hypothetical protein